MIFWLERILLQYKILWIIRNEINEISEFNNKKIKLVLIYRASRNGFTAEDFHKYYDSKEHTVSIIKAGDNIIFEGFLNIKWSNCEGNTNDDKSFLFGLNLKKTYKNTGQVDCCFEKGKGHFAYVINIYNDFSIVVIIILEH